MDSFNYNIIEEREVIIMSIHNYYNKVLRDYNTHIQNKLITNKTVVVPLYCIITTVYYNVPKAENYIIPCPGTGELCQTLYTVTGGKYRIGPILTMNDHDLFKNHWFSSLNSRKPKMDMWVANKKSTLYDMDICSEFYDRAVDSIITSQSALNKEVLIKKNIISTQRSYVR